MASVAGPDERIEEARRRWLDASAAATRAREELGRLEIEAATTRAKADIETALEQGCSPELHGELVAHAARYHGATCARASSISDVSWRGVRVAIESIVKRVKTAEKQRRRWEARTDVARSALRDLVDALSLDDGPRIEAIRRARETLERWGMR